MMDEKRLDRIEQLIKDYEAFPIPEHVVNSFLQIFNEMKHEILVLQLSIRRNMSDMNADAVRKELFCEAVYSSQVRSRNLLEEYGMSMGRDGEPAPPNLLIVNALLDDLNTSIKLYEEE